MKLESSTRPPGKSSCSCTCMTTTIAWLHHLMVLLVDLLPSPISRPTPTRHRRLFLRQELHLCFNLLNPRLCRERRLTVKQPRLPWPADMRIATEQLLPWLHCNVACGHCFCSFFMQGRRVTPGTLPSTINLQPWHHHHHHHHHPPHLHHHHQNLKDIKTFKCPSVPCHFHRRRRLSPSGHAVARPSHQPD
ncbi:hypothetical protein IWX90DRAFT_241288 [Phyllosticta citrichinensis]|uniref:Uncharacterized protein n=1 Tax=Phyllosticta citrichinensis TaxID=1130410 RepID=A0ABR1XQM0_9PEZI